VGGYNKTITIASNFVPNGDNIDVHFGNVPTAAKYTLTYLGDDGQEWPMLTNVAFDSLQDDSPPA
jgi:hypothetical protein